MLDLLDVFPADLVPLAALVPPPVARNGKTTLALAPEILGGALDVEL